MFNTPWLFGLIFIPVIYLIAFFIFGVLGEVSVFVKAYFGVGCLIATGLFLIKRSRRDRSVSPINGSIDENYDRLFREFTQMGFEIEEYEPLDGKQLKVFLHHPGKVYFILMGLFLLMAGIFPGILWFVFGRDRLAITLKENAGSVIYIFETNNRKVAGNVWQKISFKHTKELLAAVPEDLETTVDITGS